MKKKRRRKQVKNVLNNRWTNLIRTLTCLLPRHLQIELWSRTWIRMRKMTIKSIKTKLMVQWLLLSKMWVIKTERLRILTQMKTDLYSAMKRPRFCTRTLTFYNLSEKLFFRTHASSLRLAWIICWINLTKRKKMKKARVIKFQWLTLDKTR